MLVPAAIKYTNASALIRTGSGMLISALLTGGSDAATLTIYDNTEASGTVLAVLKAAANTSVSWTPGPAVCKTGLYAALAGTGPVATLVYV